MQRDQYRKIKSQLNFRRSYVATLALLACDALLLSSIVWLLNDGGMFEFLVSQVLIAIFCFHGFGLLHEAGHGNCSRHSWLNMLTGLIGSIMCFTPYYPWKHIHQKHHVWAGNAERDPTGRNLKKWRHRKRAPGMVRFAWRSWIPLLALAQHVVFLRYPFVLMKEEPRHVWKAIGSVVLLPLTYVGLWLTWPDVFNLRNFALGLVLYLAVEELVNLPHHADLFHFDGRLPLSEQWRAARSCYYPRLLSELLVLNFNFHVEHHLFPSLPWYRLRGARELVRPVLGDDYRESMGVSWNVRRRAESLHKIVLS